jgi:hypothetical protein
MHVKLINIIKKGKVMEKKIINKLPTLCPSCNEKLDIINLQCPQCHTEVKGMYPMNIFSGLTADDEEFLLCFLTSRGSLKELQERMSISYPTARTRLNKLLHNLGLSEEKDLERDESQDVFDLLDNLDKGKDDFDSVLKKIQGRKK